MFISSLIGSLFGRPISLVLAGPQIRAHCVYDPRLTDYQGRLFNQYLRIGTWWTRLTTLDMLGIHSQCRGVSSFWGVGLSHRLGEALCPAKISAFMKPFICSRGLGRPLPS